MKSDNFYFKYNMLLLLLNTVINYIFCSLLFILLLYINIKYLHLVHILIMQSTYTSIKPYSQFLFLILLYYLCFHCNLSENITSIKSGGSMSVLAHVILCKTQQATITAGIVCNFKHNPNYNIGNFLFKTP